MNEPKHGAVQKLNPLPDFIFPLRFDDVKLELLHMHIRYWASEFPDTCCVHILFPATGVEIPVIKKVFRRKPDNLIMRIQSGYVSRERLAGIREILIKNGFDLKISPSAKSKKVNRIDILISVDNPFLPVMVVNALEVAASRLGIEGLTHVSLGYFSVVSHFERLPGEVSFRSRFVSIGYKIGCTIGRLLRWISP